MTKWTAMMLLVLVAMATFAPGVVLAQDDPCEAFNAYYNDSPYNATASGNTTNYNTTAYNSTMTPSARNSTSGGNATIPGPTGVPVPRQTSGAHPIGMTTVTATILSAVALALV
ncbi:hypothetical protein Poli38472_009406 [Pythium oligandrum]|uniref:Uncharacterized protein n=1 Tax=Pythium oligandrum TaxID=41045 RepID=A0A8K1CLG5_PYTOL|nr:hypothetical protein Poli38472_009406 [Pythium oligandrum]|eukprot:TMW65239.1 hypothetical protein Poli38472_009406 [Pythium oligandrum]